MKLTKAQLKQLIKEEMGLVLQEQEQTKPCRTWKIQKAVSLWTLLKNYAGLPPFRSVKYKEGPAGDSPIRNLRNPKFCPEPADVSEYAQLLIDWISKQWTGGPARPYLKYVIKTTNPDTGKQWTCADLMNEPNYIQQFCKNFAMTYPIERGLWKLTKRYGTKPGKRLYGLQLRYLTTFLGPKRQRGFDNKEDVAWIMSKTKGMAGKKRRKRRPPRRRR